MPRALIIGGAGFIGSRLARALLDRGDTVSILARPSTSTARLEGVLDRLTLHRADDRDADALGRAFRAADAETVYCLARTPRDGKAPLADAEALVESSIGALVRILKAAAAAPPRLFVRAGTIAEYGDAAYPNDEAGRERPTTAYGAAALAGTHLLSALAPSLPFHSVTGRLALVYGPRQSTEFLVPLLVERLLAGEPVTIHDPEASRDFLYVDDAVAGLIALAGLKATQKDPINIGSGRALTMEEAAAIILKETGAASALIRRGERAKATGAQRLLLTTERAAAIANWRATIRFEDGVARLLREMGSRRP